MGLVERILVCGCINYSPLMQMFKLCFKLAVSFSACSMTNKITKCFEEQKITAMFPCKARASVESSAKSSAGLSASRRHQGLSASWARLGLYGTIIIWTVMLCLSAKGVCTVCQSQKTKYL